MYKKKIKYVKRTKKAERTLTKKQTEQVKRLINVRAELKFFDFNLYTVASDDAGSILSIMDIPQGDTDITRDGDRIMLCGYITMFLQLNSNYYTNVPPVDTWRFIIFQWHPNSVPAIGNILLPGPSSTQDVYSQYSHDFRQQYTILYDIFTSTMGQTYQTAPPGNNSPTTSITSRQWHRRIYLKRARKQVQYSAANGTTGTNKIYVMHLTDTPFAQGTKPYLNLSLKTVFRDS